jgi:glyoxylase-like metal-dependent hydrolase (beta-lactamase superfamily II)
MATRETSLADYAPVPRSALGPALNDQGYYVGRVEQNLYWVTDVTYQSALVTTSDGVVLFDAPPTIGHNIQRAVDEIAAANGVTNKVTHLIYSHHHADHAGASFLFDKDVVRIGHEETRRLLLRDDDPARAVPEETFQDRRNLEIGGERIDLACYGSNHSLDNIYIHLPDQDTLMLVDIVNAGWAPPPRSWPSSCSRGAVATRRTSTSRPPRCPSPAARARPTAATGRASPRGATASGSPVIQRPAIGDRGESERRVQRPGEALGVGGAKCSGGPVRRVGGECHGSLQERGRRGEAAARPRPHGRSLELGGDLFVGHRRSLGAVPCAAIRIDLRICYLRQCSVSHAPLVRFRRAVHG